MNLRPFAALALVLSLTACGGSAGASGPQLSTAATCDEVQTILKKHGFDWSDAADELTELAGQASSATREELLAMIASDGGAAESEALGSICYD